ncbi:MAG: hypothetical protein AB8U25_06240 [Rickettsiales endosymbiont of Dermacentor nuttalli]
MTNSENGFRLIQDLMHFLAKEYNWPEHSPIIIDEPNYIEN